MENRKEILRQFVSHTSQAFTRKLTEYEKSCQGEFSKEGQLRKAVGPIAGVLAASIPTASGNTSLSKPAFSVGDQAGGFIADLISKSKYDDKAYNVLSLTKYLNCDRALLSAKVREAAILLFISFQHQILSRVQEASDPLLIRLSRDAVDRAINYMNQEYSREADQKMPFSVNLFCDGVIYGNTKIGNNAKHKIKSFLGMETWNGAKMYESVGVVHMDFFRVPHYYRKRSGSEPGKYGFRLALPDETLRSKKFDNVFKSIASPAAFITKAGDSNQNFSYENLNELMEFCIDTTQISFEPEPLLPLPDLIKTDVNINCFWVNSPNNRKTFIVPINGEATVLQFKKRILEEMDEELSKYPNGVLDLPVSSYISVITADGNYLGGEEDYLNWKDINYGRQGPWGVLVRSHRCGLLTIAFARTQGYRSYAVKTGSTVTVDLSTDDVGTLVKKVYQVEEIPGDYEVKLVFEDGILKNEKIRLCDAITSHYPTIVVHSVQKRDNNSAMQINVKLLTGKTIVLNLVPSDTVGYIKFLIFEKKEGPPPDMQMITLFGNQVRDETVLANCKVQDGFVFHAVLRLRGGGKKKETIEFSGVADDRNLIQKVFTNPPPWRYFLEGLSIEGTCGTSSCEAVGQTVISRMGFINFHLKTGIDKAVCPICKSTLSKVITCGFNKTFWRFYGRKISNPSELLFSDWRYAGGNYTTFQVTEKGGALRGTEKWCFLVIQTIPTFEPGDGMKYPCPTHCAVCFGGISKQKTGNNLISTYSPEAGIFRIPSCGHIYHTECFTQRNSYVCNLCKITHAIN